MNTPSRLSRSVLALFAGLALAYPGGAEEPPRSPRFDQACGGDIAAFCANVTPGDGRLESCLYAHSDLLSDECYDATSAVAERLEGLFDNIAMFHEACIADIQTYCAGTEAGGGRIIKCLRSNDRSITAGCAAAMPPERAAN